MNKFLPAKIQIIIDLSFIFILAAIGGLLGGETYYHPDNINWMGLAALKNFGHPGMFKYPALVIYCHSAVYGLALLPLLLLGHLPALVSDVVALYKTDYLILTPIKIPFSFPGHLVTLFFSLIGVIGVYLLTWRLRGQRGLALLAVAFTAASFLWVSQSHYPTVDIPLGSLCLVAIFFTFIYSQADAPLNNRRLAVLGVALGLAAAAKYNGGLVFVSIATAIFLRAPYEPRRLIKESLMVLAAALVSFLIVNPYILIKYSKFISDFTFELKEARQGQWGFDKSHTWDYHLRQSLYYGYGVIPLILACLGGIRLLRLPEIRPSGKAALIVFPIFFYIFMGAARSPYQRFMLPVIPLLGIFSALGLEAIYRFFQSRFTAGAKTITVIVMAAALVPNLYLSARHNWILSRPDTRVELEAVLGELASEKTIGVFGGKYLQTCFNKIEGVKNFPGLHPDLSLNASDLIIWDSFSFDSLINGCPDALDSILPRSLMRDPSGRLATFSHYEYFFVVQISPYTIAKAQIPYAPESHFSPSPPDLAWRKQPGPFIEIYCPNQAWAEKVASACRKHKVAFNLLWTGKEGYYFERVNKQIRRFNSQPTL